MIEKETLELLEWPRLCQHLATFAATKLGAIAARNLTLPVTRSQSLDTLAQTVEVHRFESEVEEPWTLNGITDIGDALERARLGGVLSGEELINLATTLSGMRRLRRLLEAQDEGEYPVITDLITSVRTYPELEKAIHHCLDDGGDVTERASLKLTEIRQSIRAYRSQINQTLQRLLQSRSAAMQELVITQRGDRFVVPVKVTHKEQVPGIVHDMSSSGATLYVEPKSITETGNRLRQQYRREQVEVEAILRELSEKVQAVVDDLEHLLAIATTLDLATARARYGRWLEGYPPTFCEAGSVEIEMTLRQLRHPLLVWQEKHEEGASVVPIDVRIAPPTRVVAITGPNTGGKTATLKAIGLAALMAKAGLFIPAYSPVTLPWFERILADIGDEQSLQQSLSTFSGHIRRISRIVDAVADCPNSLVLLDEVGAGTDPTEGSALAIALLKHLAENSLLSVATTHFGELKALKYDDERFENASVEFNDETLSPTYRLLWGIPGRSNALKIAQRLGLNTDIIDAAETQVGGLTADVNVVLAGLEAQRREQEAKSAAAQKLLVQTEQFYQEVSNKAASLQAREQDLKRIQEQEIQSAIADAKAEIAKTIRNLQRGGTAQEAKKATEKISAIAEENLPKAKPKPLPPGYQPQVGERIRIPSLGQTAEVLAPPDENRKLSVRFGIMKMLVDLDEIESLDGKKVEPPPKPQPKIAPPPPKKESALIRTSRNTVDIRGSRVADAEMTVNNAIASAIEVGSLWIIHGKGTGKLRDGVQNYLRQHPLVKRYELAPQKEGGSGVTIAFLN